jgi:transcriptional regulator with XRE-family HTH domain
MSFAEKLRRWRKVKGYGRAARGEISQASAAAWLGVSLRTYQDWELGRHEPPAFALDLITNRMLNAWANHDRGKGYGRSVETGLPFGSEKNAGRPVASSNQKAKGTRTGIRTGKGKSNHAKKKAK